LDRAEILQRYRLALALIPDLDIAGDLFMRARSEAELRRLAKRWREQHGLGELPPVLELPTLDPFQEEHALHLYRRGWARQRTAWGLGVGLVLLLAVALGLWRLQVETIPPGYEGAPMATIALPDGLDLNVYQVEATPGQVAVWWELTGPRAEERAATLNPPLEIPSVRFTIRQFSEWRAASRSKVYGRTTYDLFLTTAQEVTLFDTALPVTKRYRETVVPLHYVSDEYQIELVEVALGEESTRLRYRAETPPRGEAGYPLEIAVGPHSLRWIGEAVPVDDSGLMELTYNPIPYGLTHLSIAMNSPQRQIGPLVYDLPNPLVLSEFTRYGDRIQAIYRPDGRGYPRLRRGSMPIFVDTEGNRYEAAENPPQAWDGELKYSLVVENPPPDVEFVQLIIPDVMVGGAVRSVTVDLTRRS